MAGNPSATTKEMSQGKTEIQNSQALRSDQLSARRYVAEYMLSRLPRELRLMIYDELLFHAPATFYLGDFKAFEDGRRFDNDDPDFLLACPRSFFQYPYFQASCLGPTFVLELLSFYLRKASLYVYVSKYCPPPNLVHTLSTDFFGLGRPLGALLRHVKVVLSSFPPPEILLGLLALYNKNCMVELVVAYRNHSKDSVGNGGAARRAPWVSADVALTAKDDTLTDLEPTLRELKNKGQRVRVRHEGEIIYSANELEESSQCTV